jgi:hypothetical protein
MREKKVENFPDFSYLVFSVFSHKYERLFKEFVSRRFV